MTVAQGGRVRNILSYLGIGESNPPDIWFAQRAPLITDFKNWDLGDIWIDILLQKAYIMLGKTVSSGTWQSLSNNDVGAIGNAGGEVETDPVTAAFTIVGTATNGINVIGTPATHNLTIGLQSPYSDGNFRFANNFYVGLAPTGTGNLEITESDAAEVNASIVNTGTGDAFIQCIVAAAGGDAFSRYLIAAGQVWSAGLDHTDCHYKVSASPNPVVGLIDITPVGEITMPLQPAFLAYNAAPIINQTGNGNVAVVAFGTELFDIGVHFAANTFTAPILGTYRFEATVQMSALAGATSSTLILVTTSASYVLAAANPTACANAAGNFTIHGSALVAMAATNTAHITLQNIGAAGDTNTINGAAGPLITYFSGKLEC